MAARRSRSQTAAPFPSAAGRPFEVHQGELTVKLRHDTTVLRSGDSIEVPRGQPHSIWNSSDTVTCATWQVRPALRTEEFFTALHEMREAGATDKRGGIAITYTTDQARRILGPVYTSNAHCSCLVTPDEPHNNCVRDCLQNHMWNLLAKASRGRKPNDPPMDINVACPLIWKHHRDCYRECGCADGFIDYLAFDAVCKYRTALRSRLRGDQSAEPLHARDKER
jgi:hypothetical protein